MRKVIQSLLLIAVLGFLAAGCDKNHNPVGSSPTETDLSANTPNAPSILGNRVWHDLNENGLQDDTLVETGFSGVTVELYSGSGVKLTTVVTNSKGIYFFPMLAAGTYSVKFSAPQGYRFSARDNGADTLDSDADPVSGQTAIITLPVSTADLTWDAGLYEGQLEEDTVVNGTVGGRVWFDVDNDGIQNDTVWNDVLTGVQVELFACDETLVTTTSTGDDGGYQFANIIPGQYYVAFTAPEGYEFSPADATDDSLDSDANALTGNTVCFRVDSAEAEAY
ncbi:MAG: calcium-binding protein, partial [candidate division Zixibacteria bacterium]|nr:calcium-binding protein [candidate division Zixibacteria bacterium]